MKPIEMTTLLRIAGILHLGLMLAGSLMPWKVGLKEAITNLPPFIRRLFWVYYIFIGLCLAGFGSITLVFAPELAAGGGLARALCAFFATFWTLRLVVAVFVLDVNPYISSPLWAAGYHATNIVFAFLPALYAWAAFFPGNR
jgi:hypothetical protein